MVSKRLLLFAVALIPISFLPGEKPNAFAAYAAYQQRVIQINELAGNTQSLDDARKLVDMVAEELPATLPPKWVTRKMRNRIARAEYESATNPARLIPEQRVAEVWNRFVREIGAEGDLGVKATEIHYLRDAAWVNGREFWAMRAQTIWSMPNIYPVGTNGKLAEGCRALDALRELHSLADQPDLIQDGRELAQKGVLPSDEMEQESKSPHRPESRGGSWSGVVGPSLIEMAVQRYAKEHGERALRHTVESLMDELFPE